MEKTFFTALALLGFLVQGDNTVISPVLPDIASDLNILIPQAAIAVAGYLIPFGIFALLHGPLADRFGQGKIIGVAAFGTAVFSSASGLASSLPILIIFRGINGFFAAGIIPITVSLIGDIMEGQEKQNQIGAYLGFTFLGQAAGTALGGSLTHYFSWRGVFILYGLLELVAAIIIYKKLNLAEGPSPNKSDIKYSSLLKKPVIYSTLPLILTNGFIVYGSFAYLGSHLKEVYDLNYLWIGIILSSFGLAAFSVGKESGRLRKLLSDSYFVLFGLMGSLSLLLYIYAGVYNFLILIISLLGFGGAFIGFQSAFITIAQSQSPQNTGTVMALVAFSLFGGGGIGTIVNRQILIFHSYILIYITASALFILLGIGSYLLLKNK